MTFIRITSSVSGIASIVGTLGIVSIAGMRGIVQQHSDLAGTDGIRGIVSILGTLGIVQERSDGTMDSTVASVADLEVVLAAASPMDIIVHQHGVQVTPTIPSITLIRTIMLETITVEVITMVLAVQVA